MLLKSKLTSWVHTIFYDTNRFWCFFCFKYHCRECMVQSYKRDILPHIELFLPHLIQFHQEVSLQQLEENDNYLFCQRAFEFILKFQYVKIDKGNPMIKTKPLMKEIFIQRRQIHKMFDQINCNAWEVIFKKRRNVIPLDYEDISKGWNLIFREAYFTFDQMRELPKLLM